jgi:heat shock protein HslJ
MIIMRFSPLMLAPALALSLLLTACSADVQSATADGKPHASLKETHWKLVELMGKPVAQGKTPPNITLSSSDNRFHGSGGCNRIMGGYELKEPNRLRFTGTASTMMACMESMELEREFLDTLEKADSYVITGETLQLNRARMAPLARFEAVYLK